MDNIWKVKPIKIKSIGLNMNSLYNTEALPDSGGQPEPTEEQIKQFKEKKDKIVDPIVKSSLREHPTDVLHGSQNLLIQVPKYSREPRDWDIFSLTEKQRAQQLEKKIDKKAKSDISKTIRKKLPQIGSTSIFKDSPKEIYMVVAPTSSFSKKESELLGVMHRPQGIKTIRKNGMTLLSLDEEIEHKNKSLKVPLRVGKASRDLSEIKKHYEENDLEWPYMKKKSMSYEQAKRRFPGLEPFGDADKDRIANMFDCKPFDVSKQGILHNIKTSFSKKVENVGKRVEDIRSKHTPEAKLEREQQKMEEERKKKKYIMVKMNGEWGSAGVYSETKYNRLVGKVEAIEISTNPNWYKTLNLREKPMKVAKTMQTAMDKSPFATNLLHTEKNPVTGEWERKPTQINVGNIAKGFKEARKPDGALTISKEGQQAINRYNYNQSQSGMPPITKNVFRPSPSYNAGTDDYETRILRQVLKTGSPQEKIMAMQYLRQKQSAGYVPSQPVGGRYIEPVGYPIVEPTQEVSAGVPIEQRPFVQQPVDTFSQIRAEEAMRMETATPVLPRIGTTMDGEPRTVPPYAPISLRQSFLIKPLLRGPPIQKQTWGQTRPTGGLISAVFKPARIKFVKIGVREENETEEDQNILS